MLPSYQPPANRENPVADLKLMRNLFREGVLASAFVSPADTGAGWLLTCVRHNGKPEGMTVDKSTRIKIYRTLDAAHRDALRVGFQTVTTELRELSVA
jgi:hypothetical protein